ncbi:MAG: polysaccharide biosynthesis C-terminal domain-containing protein, partial [Thermoplasmatales archaeon]|nr:polysaccharide biosynthesis C-terminal domain-containing protein [Thermoplasmatales archaeon]
MVLVAIAGVSIAGISPAFIWPSYLQSLQQFIADHAVESLAAIYLISWIATFLIGMWFLRKYPLKKPSWKLFKSYFSFAMPMMFLPVIGIISQNVGMLMIGYFWSSVEVGYYFTMVAVVGIVTVFPASVSAVLFPSISEYCSNKNFDKIKQTTHLAERYISMITIPILIGIMVLANPLINIVMSDAFLPAASVLIILAVFISISCLNSPYSSLIKGMDKPSILTKIGIATCLISIILNYLFIPKDGLLSSFGINGAAGAAGATVISALVGFILLRIAVKKLTGINILQSHTPRHIIAGLIAGIILYYLAFATSLFPSIYWY